MSSRYLAIILLAATLLAFIRQRASAIARAQKTRFSAGLSKRLQ